ncbi:hypothetical protein IG631_00420 [Alternaria alternata]|nr:hypothetical protein IG631_00420 [Alternaria alternata]
MPVPNAGRCVNACVQGLCFPRFAAFKQRDDVMTWWNCLSFEPLVLPPRNRSTATTNKPGFFQGFWQVASALGE